MQARVDRSETRTPRPGKEPVQRLARNGDEAPRAGIGSESYKRAVAVWCASDRAKAIGIAKAGGKLDMKTCANPVESHFQLGQRLDIGGTPAIFLDDGKVLPGYVPAPRLLAMLGLKS